MRRLSIILLLITLIGTSPLLAGEFRFNKVTLRLFCSEDWEVSKSPNQTEFTNPKNNLNIVVEVSSTESITAKQKKAEELLNTRYDSFEISVNYSRKVNNLPCYNIEGKAIKNGKTDYFHICFIDNNQQTLIISGSFPQDSLEVNKESMRTFLDSIQTF